MHQGVHLLSRFRAFVLLALLFGTFTLASARAADSTPTGSLVIIGGALRYDNPDVWPRIVSLAGGKGAKIAVFASAAGNPKKSSDSTIAALNQAGANAFFVPVAVRLKDRDWKQAVNDPALIAQVKDATGVYFTGGAQERITQVLYTEDGKNSAMLDAVWQVYRKGGVIAGTSAGAAIMSTTMFRDAMDVLSTMKFGVNDGKEIDRGLGFVGPDVFIDQHFLARGRFARVLPVMLKKGYKLGLGIDENTAMIVTGGSQVEVLGASGAVALDLTDASHDSNKPDFNLKNVRISYLDRGDRYDIKTRVGTPSAAKLKDLKIDPNAADFKPFFSETRFFPDVLGNRVLVDLLGQLVDGPTKDVVGLSFGAPDGKKPELGFEFRFRRGADTLGWYTGSLGGEEYTVLNAYLDITPITLATPLYTAR